MSVKTIFNFFKKWNWCIALKVWQLQKYVVDYFTDNNNSRTIVLSCGIAGTIYTQIDPIASSVPEKIQTAWKKISLQKIKELHAEEILELARTLKSPKQMYDLSQHSKKCKELEKLAQDIEKLVEKRLEKIQKQSFSSAEQECIIQQNHLLLDTSWAINNEVLNGIEYACDLFPGAKKEYSIFKEALAVTSVLRGLDKKMETRGRDSCGLSIMLRLSKENYQKLITSLKKNQLETTFKERQQIKDLSNYTIDVYNNDAFVVTFTYKIANAIGLLGDNVACLAQYIKQDAILKCFIATKHEFCSTIIHTRWASQGIVSLENCHPVDNKKLFSRKNKQVEEISKIGRRSVGHIYAALNGDIDNHISLREKYNGKTISQKITTDAKIIPLAIEKYLCEGNDLKNSFCNAIKDFNGSFAIEMHCDGEPGKIYLALQGKGQGLYIGLSPHGYYVASEIYGFVEHTNKYITLEPGQIVILDQNSPGGTESIQFFDTSGNPIKVEPKISSTPITTRDIFLDTTKYQHFLQKEIHEAPDIIRKTLRGKWEKNKKTKLLHPHLGPAILPQKIKNKLKNKEYKNIYFIGMGTAHAAAEAIAVTHEEIFQEYGDLRFISLLATEFMATYTKKDRSSSLVIGISQSGGTTDTNTAIRKFTEDKADVLGIINKRDSDMSFLVEGVLYTGDGRDVEIAVASTKAFYAQVTAGTLYALAFAEIMGIDAQKIDHITSELLELPQKLERLFTQKSVIEKSAKALAPRHTYWDTLSTGVGKAAADEIKIKLSELCYMSIPSFAAANKKHINLSAEALILCFLGGISHSSTMGNKSSLAKDLRGEIAIFLAQSNTPIVITTENDTSYDDLIPVEKQGYLLLKVIPDVSPYLAVVLNTAVGHLWAYYAAQALHERSLFLSEILDDINKKEQELHKKGVDSHQIISNSDFHSVLEKHYRNFLAHSQDKYFNNGLFAADALELERLFLLALGIIPSSATPLLYGKNWASQKILDELKSKLSYLRTWLARSIDAIKHQAKYITVGVTGFEGITDIEPGAFKNTFDKLLQDNLLTRYEEDLNEYDMITLTNIQTGIHSITGGLLYNVYLENDNIFLETIMASPFGNSQNKKSRYEQKTLVRGGRKAVAVKNDKIHIGKGHDNENTISIPIRSLGKIVKILLCKFETKETLSGKQKVQLLGGVNVSRSKAEEIFIAIEEHHEKILNAYHFSNNTTSEELLAKVLENISVYDLLLLPHEDISEKIIATLQ